MTYLLDTTVLVYMLRGRQDVSRELDRLVTQGHLLATTAINVGEVYAGMMAHEKVRTEQLFRSLDCYEISAAIGKRAGALKNEQARRGKTLSLADMIVAATALEHDLVLITDNRKDFPIPELRFHE